MWESCTPGYPSRSGSRLRATGANTREHSLCRRIELSGGASSPARKPRERCARWPAHRKSWCWWLRGCPVVHRDRTRFTEIKASQQLAHDHDVGAANELSAQRRTIFERGKTDRGTQIGISAELSAQPQQSSLGTKMIGIMIERGTSHRAQQDCRGRKASLNRVRGQRIIHRSRAPRRRCLCLKLKLMAERSRQPLAERGRLVR